MAIVQIGTVKFFNNRLGYGFIIPDSDAKFALPDVLLHHSVIDMPGFRTLPEGTRVKFTSTRSSKGFAATWCQQLSDEPLNAEAEQQRKWDVIDGPTYYGG